MWDANDFTIILGGGIGFTIAATINAALTQARIRRMATGDSSSQARRLSETEVTRARHLGTISLVLGVMVLPAGSLFIAWLQQNTKNTDTVTISGIAGGVVTCGLCIASAMLIMRGRRMRAVGAERKLADDVRPKVVYLRPFHFDRESRVAAARSEMFKSTHEQRLARALRAVGPFVALGDPSETFPDPGAIYVHADEAHWREAVQNLTRSAGTIVLHVGDSPGLAWEVQHLVELGQPERIIISLVTEDRGRYDDFRAKLGHLLPRGLPADIGTAQFLYFDADWIARPYDRITARHHHPPPGSPGEQRAAALRRLVDPARGRALAGAGCLTFAVLIGVVVLTI